VIVNSRHSQVGHGARGSILAGFVVLTLAATLARPALADAKKDQAEVHYDQGKAYYRAGAFDLAITEFLEGYKLDPRAGVLFNIARGYEELKNRDKAIEFYKKYIDLGAQAAAATEARARLVVLERQIKDEGERKKAEAAEAERKRQEALNPPPAMPTPVETTVPGAKPPEAPVASAPPPAAVEPPASQPTDSPELAHKLKIAGLATGGAGVVLAGVGGFFAWRASSIKSDIGKEMIYSPSKDSDYKSASMLSVVGFVAGGVAIAGGAVLYTLGWSKSPHDGGAASASTALLVPTAGPDGGGLSFSGSF
jgi:tetratricopeptide (TPR) repeat protein